MKKPVKLFDGRGLYLEISPNDSRGRRLKYRFAGKRNASRSANTVYPRFAEGSREKCDAARKQIAAGIDPSDARELAKIALRESVANTFEAMARKLPTQSRINHSEFKRGCRLIKRV
jgi:hypothetical protein